MDPILIQFFKAAVPGAPAAADPAKLQADAFKCGFIIHPDLLNTDLEAFIARQTANPNATFYKRWEDMMSKDRIALLLDQITHYASTYGSGYTQPGNGYVPNDGAEAPDFRELTLIAPVSEEELYGRCLKLIRSGAALKGETVKALCSAVTDHLSAHPEEAFDIDSVRNREALSILCKALGRRPSAPVELLRYIVYEATGQTLLIQSADMLALVRGNAEKFDFRQLSQAELDALASIFYRFKNLLLAFRTQEDYDRTRRAFVQKPSCNRAVVNRIRRAAERLLGNAPLRFCERERTARPARRRVRLQAGHPAADHPRAPAHEPRRAGDVPGPQRQRMAAGRPAAGRPTGIPGDAGTRAARASRGNPVRQGVLRALPGAADPRLPRLGKGLRGQRPLRLLLRDERPQFLRHLLAAGVGLPRLRHQFRGLERRQDRLERRLQHRADLLLRRHDRRGPRGQRTDVLPGGLPGRHRLLQPLQRPSR